MHFIPGDIPPLLNKLFNALQSIPPTSVESERAFSITGQFATKLRKKLADNTLNSLFVYLNYVCTSSYSWVTLEEISTYVLLIRTKNLWNKVHFFA